MGKFVKDNVILKCYIICLHSSQQYIQAQVANLAKVTFSLVQILYYIQYIYLTYCLRLQCKSLFVEDIDRSQNKRMLI